MSINKILNLFWATRCMGCKNTSSLNRYGFCRECEEQIIHIENYNNTETFHILRYDGPVKEAIHWLKYNRKKYYGKRFALLIHDFLINNSINNFNVIIPVPLYWTKEFFRGFNQCSIIAFYLSKLLKKQYLSGVLVKCKNTLSQTAMDKTGREKNVKGSFNVKKRHLIKNKKVLLIDDVYTSGATTQEAKKTLLENGAEKVIILTIAKV
ncbi:MAG: ComF family protein [Candidatus Omnitrophica bacterium]|nr:ComF family protein [Candidatus Omnitrophota bacterium]MCM8776649.1 ComF family protein [Candidatus Omnitrophota bacterium]